MKKNKRGKYQHIEHVDHIWLHEKMGTHGSIYHYDSINGLAGIDYIYGKNKLKIFYYNVILYLKYLKRNIKSCFWWRTL